LWIGPQYTRLGYIHYYRWIGIHLASVPLVCVSILAKGCWYEMAARKDVLVFLLQQTLCCMKLHNTIIHRQFFFFFFSLILCTLWTRKKCIHPAHAFVALGSSILSASFSFVFQTRLYINTKNKIYCNVAVLLLISLYTILWHLEIISKTV